MNDSSKNAETTKHSPFKTSENTFSLILDRLSLDNHKSHRRVGEKTCPLHNMQEHRILTNSPEQGGCHRDVCTVIASFTKLFYKSMAPWEGVEGWRGVRDEPHVDLVYPAAGSQQVPIQSLGVAGRSLPTKEPDSHETQPSGLEPGSASVKAKLLLTDHWSPNCDKLNYSICRSWDSRTGVPLS